MSVSIEADLYDFIRDSIRHWVGENFGSQELDDPSWNIDDLSAHLVNKLSKRERLVKTIRPFGLTVVLKASLTDDERAKLMGRITEKLERLGGSLKSIVYSCDTLVKPMKGETEVVRAVVEVDVPYDEYMLRGLERWLQRQCEGHDLFLSYMLTGR